MIEIATMYTHEDRVKLLLSYQQKLKTAQTYHERMFQSILETIGKKKTGDVTLQQIFTDGRIAYIADFYLYKYRLVFEIDGKQHDAQVTYDKHRTAFLNSYFNIRVVRFNNDQVINNEIISKITSELRIKNVRASLFVGMDKKQIRNARMKARNETSWLEECGRQIN